MLLTSEGAKSSFITKRSIGVQGKRFKVIPDTTER
ncbi:MAG: hypothetical protein ACJAS3_000326 [Roseivirga sp.]|jgi:hypothetical protein